MTYLIAPGMATIDDIVSEVFDLAEGEIYLRTRERRITDPRKLAIYARVTINKERPYHIGPTYGLHHATIHSSLEVVRNLMRTDKEFAGKARAALSMIRAMKNSLKIIAGDGTISEK